MATGKPTKHTMCPVKRKSKTVFPVESGITTKHEQFITHDSGARAQFASGMQRDTDEDKVLWHLVASGPMLRRWAELLTRGARKYDADNWMKANGEEEYNRFRASAFRHFMQWYYGIADGEDHAAAVLFNVNGAEYVASQREEILR